MNDTATDPSPAREPRPRRRSVAWVLGGLVCAAAVWGVVTWVTSDSPADDDGARVTPVSGQGTVVLVPAPDSPVPYRWALYPSRRAVEAAATSDKSWGPVRVATGRYYLGLKPYNIRCREVVFPDPVEARAGEVTRVDVSARVGVRAPKGFGPVHQWSILPTDRDRPIQFAQRNWQAQIVPPGRYRIRVTQRRHHSRGVVWPGTVEARPGTCVWVDLQSSVAVVPTRDGRWIQQWQVRRAEDGTVVQTAYRTWSPQLIPPGRYRVAVRGSRHCRLDVVLPEVIELESGTHATVTVTTRLAVSAPDGAPLVDRWLVYPAGAREPIQIVERAWEEVIVPPGTYQVRVVQQADAREVPVATDVRVAKGGTTQVHLSTRLGIARTRGLRLPYEWLVYRAGDWDPVQVARRTWQAQYVPPGAYRVAVRQAPDETPVLFPEVVTLERGQVATTDVGSRLRPDVAPGVGVPDRWRILDARTGKVVKVVHGRWGVQTVPPGRYRVEIRRSRDTGRVVAWPDTVEVRRGGETVLPLRSGLHVVADTNGPVPPRWQVVDASGGVVQWGLASWPTVLLPPGTYRVRVRWHAGADYHVLAEGVVVRADRMTSVAVRKGQIPGELFGE